MAKTRAQENRAIRQEALREQLTTQGHLQHCVEIANKFNEPLDKEDQERYKIQFDMKMRLVDKYLGSVKAVEITSHEENRGIITDKPITPEDWAKAYEASLEPTSRPTESAH